MPIDDLRDWIQRARDIGELEVVQGADWNLELGGLVDVVQQKMGGPALLFDNITGYPAGYRVLANVITSEARLAMTLGLPGTYGSSMEIVRALKAFNDEPRSIAPNLVEKGPVLENSLTGSAVDLFRFPSPFWHEEDGGRYIGTGCLVIMRDPETGWVNLGAYRTVVHDERTVGIRMARGRHGDTIAKKYWDRGEACPVAISVGQDPLLMTMAGTQVKHGVGEYEVAGGMRGAAIDVVSGPITGLPVPASAEIVLEGFMQPNDLRDEGPFGEWHGYYASGYGAHGVRPCPAVHIDGISHRDDPIILGVMPRRPPNDNTYFLDFMSSAAIWHQLEGAGIPGVTGVWQQEAGGSRMLLVISIKQLYPGHAKQVLLGATATHAGAYANRFVIVVDEDIDPTNLDEVMWAVCTRTDPKDDVEIIKKCWSGPADPMAYPVEHRYWNSRCLIDACRPWDQLATFAKVVRVSDELRAKVVTRWNDLLARRGYT